MDDEFGNSTQNWLPRQRPLINRKTEVRSMTCRTGSESAVYDCLVIVETAPFAAVDCMRPECDS